MITLTQPVGRTARKPAPTVRKVTSPARRVAQGAILSPLNSLGTARNAAVVVGSLALLGAAGKAVLGFAAALGLIAFVLPILAALVAGAWVFQSSAHQGRSLAADFFALGVAAAAAVLAPLAASCGAIFGLLGAVVATLTAAIFFGLVSILAIDVANHRTREHNARLVAC
jgi:hypothetical protein